VNLRIGASVRAHGHVGAVVAFTPSRVWARFSEAGPPASFALDEIELLSPTPPERNRPMFDNAHDVRKTLTADMAKSIDDHIESQPVRLPKEAKARAKALAEAEVRSWNVYSTFVPDAPVNAQHYHGLAFRGRWR
jgi:hypothetical protein